MHTEFSGTLLAGLRLPLCCRCFYQPDNSSFYPTCSLQPALSLNRALSEQCCGRTLHRYASQAKSVFTGLPCATEVLSLLVLLKIAVLPTNNFLLLH
jgi:hypothetical protein